MEHLPIKDLGFEGYLNKVLKDTGTFKISRIQLHSMISTNSRNTFWGLRNCLDGILEDTGVSYHFDTVGDTATFSAEKHSFTCPLATKNRFNSG